MSAAVHLDHETIPPISLSSPTNMATTTNQPRRLSSRRGSVTAPDPHGVHKDMNQNPSRTSTSTLTIVRVTSPVTTPPPTLHEPPSSPVLGARRLQRRLANNPSSPPAPDLPPSNRVSFAFSSFAGGAPAHGGPAAPQRDRSSSPSSSPKLRPSSPRLAATTSFPTSKPRLTPDQLVELARQSTNPATLALNQQSHQHSTPHSGPSSPGVAHSPVLRAHSPAGSRSSTHPIPAPQEQVHPATFTPLPDDIYLPFIDRPAEVASLISSPPDVKLFTLLAQTFPKRSAPDDPSVPDNTSELPRDPAAWAYAHLIHHLTKIDRDVAPDPIWAIAARKCIITHSELIWERVKGAFGIPPELDVDYDFLADDQGNESSSSSVHTSDISDDEGRAANGHWSDWDAIMDSPIHTRSKRLSMESASGSLYMKYRGEGGDSPRIPHNEADLFRAHVYDRLQGLQEGHTTATPLLDIPSTGENTVSPTPAGHMSPPEVFEALSPPESFISIEPLIASSVSPGSTNPPPLSLPSSLGAAGVSSDGLGDIAEGAEEEEEETETAASAVSDTNSKPNAPDDSEFISPSQIQGLRISTAPFPAAGTPILSPTSPVPQFLSQGPGSRPQSRASSFSSYVGPFQRSESASNLAAMRAALQAENAARGGYSSSGYASSDAGDYSDTPYDPVADRAPGNPLFPSNFARLALGPTLKANNPNLRSPPPIPASRYPGRGIRTGLDNPHLAGKTRAYSHSAAGVSGGGPGLAAVRSGLREESNLLSTSNAIGRTGESKKPLGGGLAPPGDDSALSIASG